MSVAFSFLPCLDLLYRGWFSDAFALSAFDNLRKFTLRVKDNDPENKFSMGESRTVLDRNEHTLKHLILGGGLAQDHPWDFTFKSNHQ